jgi:hypothetical protein
MERARRLAVLRNNPKVERGNIGGRALNKATTYDAHLDGARAEVACCKYFKFPVDTSEFAGGDGHRPDLFIGELGCEVKACTYRPPILKFNNLSEFASDVAIVCVVNRTGGSSEAIVELWGCISRRKFLANYERFDFGHGVRVIARHGLLSSVDRLWAAGRGSPEELEPHREWIAAYNLQQALETHDQPH